MDIFARVNCAIASNPDGYKVADFFYPKPKTLTLDFGPGTYMRRSNEGENRDEEEQMKSLKLRIEEISRKFEIKIFFTWK